MANKLARPRSGRRLHAVEKEDIAIARAVAIDETKRAGRWLGRFAELGDQPPLRILCAATLAAGIAGGDRKLIRTGVRMGLAHGLATAGKAFVKDAVDRTRPKAAMSDGRYRMKPGRSRDHDLQSMPSGHSAGVMAVACAGLVDYPSLALPVGMTGAAIVAAQLPSRNHFLSDVLAGSAIGVAAFALSRLLLPAD